MSPDSEETSGRRRCGSPTEFIRDSTKIEVEVGLIAVFAYGAVGRRFSMYAYLCHAYDETERDGRHRRRERPHIAIPRALPHSLRVVVTRRQAGLNMKVWDTTVPTGTTANTSVRNNLLPSTAIYNVMLIMLVAAAISRNDRSPAHCRKLAISKMIHQKTANTSCF